MLPPGTEPGNLGEVEGLSPGLMSAGLSTVSATQTYLDISAGNRIFTSLYPGEDPVVLRPDPRVPGWDEIVERAEDAPADLVPGLLGSTLEDAGVPRSADGLLTSSALIAVDEEGFVERAKPFTCVRTKCPGFAVTTTRLDELPAMVERLQGDDLLIAIERPPPPFATRSRSGSPGAGSTAT